MTEQRGGEMTDSSDLNALADELSFAATNTNGCLYSQRKMLNNAAKALRAAASSQAGVLAMLKTGKFLAVCASCVENNAEGCGHFDCDTLRQRPDGEWTCEICWDDDPQNDVRWIDLPAIDNIEVLAGVETQGSESQAKATEGKAGMAGVADPVRRSTAGTGLRVGEASADLPATSEFMDVTAGETATFPSEAPPSQEVGHNWQLSDDGKKRIAEIDGNILNAALNADNIIAGGMYGEHTPVTVRASTSETTPARDGNEALRAAERSFEAIRLLLISNLDEPERSAFWLAVRSRDELRAALSTPAPAQQAVDAEAVKKHLAEARRLFGKIRGDFLDPRDWCDDGRDEIDKALALIGGR